jgi:hypothetical protein
LPLDYKTPHSLPISALIMATQRRKTARKGAQQSIGDSWSLVIPAPRGFQHTFASGANTSKRTQAAHLMTHNKKSNQSECKKKRDRHKKRKVEALEQVRPSTSKGMDKTFFTSNKPSVFFSGTSEKVPTNAPENSVSFSATDLQVVDTVKGCQMKLANNDVVFLLIPREAAIDQMTYVKDTVSSLFNLEQAKKNPEKRGKKRIPVAEDDGKHTTVGLKPNRGSKGIVDSWPANFAGKDKKQIMKLMKGCENVAKDYIASDEMRGVKSAREAAGWKQIGEQQIWSSLACGKNYYLNSHTDEDFFYSITTIVSNHGLKTEIDRYELDAQVCSYFVFAEQGVAVALRPGDMLLFNPLYQHCLSSRTSECVNKDIFCLSLYLKTAVVGKNDNTLPLTTIEKTLLA